MNLSHGLLLLFILVPVVEIYFFILVGGMIGVLPTLLFIVVTAVIGTKLLKAQGTLTLQRAQLMMQQGQAPTEPLLEGILIIASGFLLVTPGFFTDSIGFLFLFPMPRRFIARWLGHRIQVQAMGDVPNQDETFGRRDRRKQPKPHQPVIIEGEYKREDD
ncbi:FxsA family protein [Candidatus Albibeggiatoa sp. nov. NOAA]|uniref:FxsA family protein n=1 Tax=Candidatus Albibeggiatoa sp. nov. NOAA TaxID=3162724 RepID=UPI0032F7F476|nr:FxsA family protein [Thiotrichaceae bacterium]